MTNGISESNERMDNDGIRILWTDNDVISESNERITIVSESNERNERITIVSDSNERDNNVISESNERITIVSESNELIMMVY